MITDKKNKDVFLEFVGSVKPLKKSGKNYKKTKMLKINKLKKNTKPQTIENNKSKDEILPTKEIGLKIEFNSIQKKLKKGKVKIEKKIDFHGLSVDEAKKIFFKEVNDCFHSNVRCLLFVTGKGLHKNNKSFSSTRLFHGKIRDKFKEWVYEKSVSSKILNVVPADTAHGGDGAFFVYLRKNKIKLLI